jgi:hypothetical protein
VVLLFLNFTTLLSPEQPPLKAVAGATGSHIRYHPLDGLEVNDGLANLTFFIPQKFLLTFKKKNVIKIIESVYLRNQ